MEEMFLIWKTTLMKDLRAPTQLEGGDEASRMLSAMKQQEIALHCYQAEESLTDAELALLKQELRVSELQWHVYRSKLWPPPE